MTPLHTAPRPAVQDPAASSAVTRAPSGSASPGDWVIVKSRTRGDRGEEYRLDEVERLQCDLFDGALRHPDSVTRDHKGRFEFRLPADAETVRQALHCTETQIYAAPPTWGEAQAAVLDRLLDYLGPRPWVAAREAEAEALAAAQAAAEAIPPGYVRLEAGTFTMGSPVSEEGRKDGETQHMVTLSRPFMLKATPLTQGEYEEVMGINPSQFQRDPESARRPVEQVSYYQALACCNALSRREGLMPYYELGDWDGSDAYPGSDRIGRAAHGLGYRLPTEAEWEYAARAGSSASRHGNLDAIAWHWYNAGGRTHAVGQKAANAWGLHDMLGNVAQWVEDRYGLLPSTAQHDPMGAELSSERVVRGSSWRHDASLARAANRYYHQPSMRHDGVGFRPARSLT